MIELILAAQHSWVFVAGFFLAWFSKYLIFVNGAAARTLQHMDSAPLLLNFSCSYVFQRHQNRFSPSLNIQYLQGDVYRIIGRMIYTIIVQGSEPPSFLSPHVVDYVMSGNILQVDVNPDDIGDPELRENLKKVKQINSAFPCVL